MLENMFVKKTDEDNVEISVRSRDYGKLRGAEEGILTRTGIKKGSKRLVKRPFFHLSENDKEKIVNSPEVMNIFKRAVKRLNKN